MIELSDQHFIAKGVFCQCFANPSNKEECIKISLGRSRSQKRLDTDVSYFAKLHKRKVDLTHIADYLGMCETSLGFGYKYECIRDHNLEVSKRLEYYLECDEIDHALLYNKLEKLASYLLKNKILISDIHARNILIQINEVGDIKPMIVDGIGDRVAIKVLNLLPGAVAAKIIRRWNRFAMHELGGKAMLNAT